MLNDRLDDLFNADKTETPRAATSAPQGYRPAEQLFAEDCRKCRGRGRFISYSGRDIGPCFTCKGKRQVSYKTAPEVRAQNRATTAARKARSAEDNADDFMVRFQSEAAWMVAAAGRGFRFACEMVDTVGRFGDLTDNQMGAVRKFMAADAERVTQQAARGAGAPVADTAGVDRLKAAFDKAVAYTTEKGLKLSPRITIGSMVISPAKAASANPGALYVKSTDRTYLGKVADGRFFASRECTEGQKAQVLTFIADPAAASKVYGQTTGTCCVCNATLRSEWKNRGIGPICAKKFGW